MDEHIHRLSPTDLVAQDGVTVGVKPRRIYTNLFWAAIIWPVSMAIAIGFWKYVVFNPDRPRLLYLGFLFFIAFIAHGMIIAMPILAVSTWRNWRRRRRYVISRDYFQAVETVQGYDRVTMQVPLRNIAWIGTASLTENTRVMFLDLHNLHDPETMLPGWKPRTRTQFNHDYLLTSVQCDWNELVNQVNLATSKTVAK